MEEVNRRAEDLIGGVSVDAASTLVPEEDHATQILGDDCVFRGRLNDAAQEVSGGRCVQDGVCEERSLCHMLSLLLCGAITVPSLVVAPLRRATCTLHRGARWGRLGGRLSSADRATAYRGV